MPRTPDGPDRDGDVDELIDALAAAQRRRVLASLLGREPQHVSTLSGTARELIDAHEALLSLYLSGSYEIAAVDKELLRKRHVHLPKLAEYGFTEWDRDDNVVSRGARFDEIRPFLELLDAREEEQGSVAAGELVQR